LNPLLAQGLAEAEAAAGRADLVQPVVDAAVASLTLVRPSPPCRCGHAREQHNALGWCGHGGGLCACATYRPLPECEGCGERDATVTGGGDREGVAVPALCGTCRCWHKYGSLHDDECRESPSWCHGCAAIEHGHCDVPHAVDCEAAP
jgi:hypothetical protein